MAGNGKYPTLFGSSGQFRVLPECTECYRSLARARRYLDDQGGSGRVTLVVTGGLRTPMDFVKALALGAHDVAVSNSAMQAIGCVAARMCNTNNCRWV